MLLSKIKYTVKIDGMRCSHCAMKMENEFKKIKEVNKVKIDLEKKQAILILKEDISEDLVKTAVRDAGFDFVSLEKE